jgi:mRNA-degrading endonuclease RelE of RelBE toxin-antitoxin system
MSFNIIPTPPFERELKQLSRKYPSIKKDIAELGSMLLKEPKMGIPLGNDCYKIRMAISSKGKGKSGGARVITYVAIIESNIFLLSIYDKSEAKNISDKELKERVRKLK